MHNKILDVILVCLLLVGPAAADMDVYEGGSIQAALTNATSGETITVHAGTYYENVLIIVPDLSLRGDNATIQAKVESAPALQISAEGAVIDGFTITGSWKGIYNTCVTHAIITNNTIYGNKIGIDMRDACMIRIHNNTIRDNTEGGIYTIRSSHMNIENNTVHNNVCLGGIFMSMSDHNTVKNNRVHDNVCQYGGITVYSSNWNVVSNNQAYANGWGIYLCWSEENTIHNNFCEDGGYAYRSSPNSWNLTLSNHTNIVWGNNSGGNYWGDYIGIDEDGDGIGDTPYHIHVFGETDQDELPLSSPACGDCDWNGYTSANDVIEAYRKAVDPNHNIPHEWVVDVDGNNYISANDVVEIYRRAVDPNHKLHCRLNTE